ncbi:nitrate/nitrite transporter [Chloroflexota bacterium]
MRKTSELRRDSTIITACFTLSFCAGPFYVLTVFFTSLEADFGWSRTLISSLHSTFLLMAVPSNLIIGWMTDRYGPKLPLLACGLFLGVGLVLISQVQSIGQVLLFYALASLGAAALGTVPWATVQRLLPPERLGLGLGIATAGTSVSRLVLSPISSLLLLTFGWRTAYIFIGVVTWLLVSIAALLLPSRRKQKPEISGNAHPHETQLTTAETKASSHTLEAEKQMSFKEIIRTKAFLLTCLMFMFPIACNQMVGVHIVPFAEGVGISKTSAATAAGLMGAFGLAGNITWPAFSGKISWRWLVVITTVGCSMMMVVLMATSSLWMLYLFVVFYGFFFFGNMPTRLGFARYLFGSQSLASTTGILLSAGALFGMFTTIASGYIYDTTESYSIAFIIGAVLFAMAAFIAVILKRPARSQDNSAL